MLHSGITEKVYFSEEYAHSNTLFYDYSVYSKLKKFYLNKINKILIILFQNLVI